MPKSEALQAFLSPKTPRFLHHHHNKENGGGSNSNGPLQPDHWAQKIATVLHPGPPFYSRLDNSDLIQALGDASVMNWAAGRAQSDAAIARRAWELKRRPRPKGATASTVAEPWLGVGTTWSALDSLPVGVQWGQIPHDAGEGAAAADAAAVAANGKADDGLWSSVCFSADLNGDNVALEKSVVIPSHVLDQHNFFRGNCDALHSMGVGHSGHPSAQYYWDDFSQQKTPARNDFFVTTDVGLPSSATPTSQSPYGPSPVVNFWEWPSWLPFAKHKNSQTNGDGKDDDSNQKNDKGQKRVWIPSATKVSFQAHWWGYTLYLPTPVMNDLEKDEKSAEDIAQTISRILVAVLNQAAKLPLPAALSGILTILKSIAPVTNYIASFIGWSWNELKSHDKGQGVCLSATWILPVALIPRDWDAPSAPPDKDGDGVPDGPPTGADTPPTTPKEGEQPTAPSAPQSPKEGEQPGAPQPAAPSAPQSPKEGEQPAAPQPAAPSAPQSPKEGEQPAAPQPAAPSAPQSPKEGEQPAAPQPAPVNGTAPAAPQTPKEGTQPTAPQPPTDSEPTKGDEQPAAPEPPAGSYHSTRPVNAPLDPPAAPTEGNGKTGEDVKPITGSPPQEHLAEPNKGEDVSRTLAPAGRGSEPPAAGAPPATIDPSKRAEYPKNTRENEKPAPGATLPPVDG